MADESNTQDRSAIIDESSISPVRDPSHVRQNSLEKHLQQRPDPQSLKDRHILLDSNATPQIQQRALELERQKVTDSLKKGLERRPDREELVERNILPDSTAAPSIQGQAKELEKSMRADSLNEKIAARPDAEKLVKEGILQEDPRGESYEEKMEDEYAKREGGA